MMCDWANLPSVVLTEIFIYLGDHDRARMARVCTSWSYEFHNSRLWTHRTFRFGGYRYNNGEFSRALGYARRHGDALKTLTITCEHPAFILCRRFQRVAGSFLGILSWKRTQLKEFKMRQLYMERHWRHELLRERLISSFSRFFMRQKELTLFDMSDATMPLNPALGLLGSVSRRCGATMRYLYLQDFFQPRTPAFRTKAYLDIMHRFMALVELHLNYCCVSDQLLEALKSNCAQLENLNIKITKTEPRFHTIDSASWINLKRACRSLNVCMDFEGIGKFDELRRVLRKEIPLQSLHIWTGVHALDDISWRLDDLLRYIGEAFANSLEETWLAIETGREVIDGGLLEMLKNCRQLEILDVQACLSVSTIETIFQLQEQYKLGLLICHLLLDGLSGQQAEQLEQITDRYAALIQERGIDFYVHYNEIPLM